MAKLYIVGIGPGGREHLTLRAVEALRTSRVIVGYTFYIELIREFLDGKTLISTGMTREIERCQRAIAEARNGHDTCLISTGDPGLYGMAGPALELAGDIDVEVVPGVSSAFAAAAEVGAPIMHDMCTISLSDLLTPWELIEKRLRYAAQADFVIALYNPKSKGRPQHLQKAVTILREWKADSTPVAIVKNAGRPGTERTITTLAAIAYEMVDMKTVALVGNSTTVVKHGRMITSRGYVIK